MEKVEILAPAGTMESLVAAINKGADAVYLGGNKFSARAYASNFDNDNMLKAVDYAHSYNVKVYVTINTYQFYIETVIAIKDAYEKLNDKEKQVISMIFYAKEKEANQRSVAKKLGVSQPFVSRTVKKFRNYLKE